MFKAIGKTDIGLKRKINQDYFEIGTIFDASWAIVCDGLGGEKAGDVASKTATQIIKNHILETYKPNMSSEKIKKMLISSFNFANIKIFDMGNENPDYKGMATTAILSFIVNNQLYITHVGDSRIYLIDKEKVTQLTTDDSLVQALVDKGTLSEEEAKKHPKRNYLTKAIGVEKDIDVYYESIEVNKDNQILMCSDGLYNYLDNETIFKELKLQDIKEKSDEITERFIQLALKGGGDDNITVVIIFNNN